MINLLVHPSADFAQTMNAGPAGNWPCDSTGTGCSGTAVPPVTPAAPDVPAPRPSRKPVTVSATATTSTAAHPATIRQRLDSGSRKFRLGSRPWLMTSTRSA